ncbi:MAG: T9SS type A sorting domain-containing protein [Flavobacteriales bacterium]
MKTLLLMSFVFFVSICANAQQANFIWGKQYGGPDSHLSRTICTDPFGNIITSGHFSGFADFDPGTGSTNLTSNGLKDGYVGKLDNNGNYLWAVSFGGVSDDEVWDIATDNFGNVIVVGSFNSPSFDADPGPNTATINAQANFTTCAFVIKLDANGTYLWSASYSTPLQSSYAAAKAVDADSNGNITVCGEMNLAQFDEIDFDPGFGTNELNENYRYFFLKLTPSGAFVDVFGLEGSYNSIAQISDMEVDNESNIIFSGYYYYLLDFDISATDYEINGNGYYFSFVCKLGASGEFQWVSAINDQFSSLYCSSLDIDNDGNIFLTGRFASTTDFNPELLGENELVNTSGYENGYLLKLDEMGGYVYAKNMAPGNASTCNDVTHDEEGNVYVIGSFTGTVDLNPDSDGVENYTSNNSTDVFVTKLDIDGNFQHTNVFGGSFTDEGRAILYPSQGVGYVATGIFSNTMDLDPDSDVFNLTSGGGTDAFIAKYNECQPVATSFDAVGCGNYEWNDQAYTLPGSYQQTFTAASGCDSLVTMNLVLNTATSSNLTVEACALYVFDGIELSASGNYIATLTNALGCDSIVYLNLTIVSSPVITFTISGNTITANSAASEFQWFNCTTEEIIEGATSASYSPTQSGLYGLYAYLGPCTELDCINFNYVGVNEKESGTFYVYPNPAGESINISTPLGWNNARITIMNSSGSLVLDQNTMGDFQILDVSSLTTGIYYIQLMSNGELLQQKFMKE